MRDGEASNWFVAIVWSSGAIMGILGTDLYKKHTTPDPSSFPRGSCSEQAVECAAKDGRFWVSRNGEVECTRTVNVK